MFGWNNPAWDPWRDIQRMQAEMDRLLQEVGSRQSGETPPIDVWSNEDGLFVRALVPGSACSELDVSVVGDTLTIRGQMPEQKLEEGASWHRRERDADGRFARTLQLPFAVEADGVKAHCKDGVLEIELPRAASDKPRRIEIKAD